MSLPLNTSYGGNKQIDPEKAYSAARAAIMARYSAKPETPKQGYTGPKTQAYWGEGNQPIAGIPYAKAPIDPNKPQWGPKQTFTNNQTGQQTQSYLPPDYQTAQGLPGKYETPSAPENLRLRNLPENLGAGQYVVDTEQPGSLIRSKRGVRPDQFTGSPVEYSSDTVGQLSKDILGGATSGRGTSGGGFQIDHIVPLWLGGADTPENKQLLSPTTHDKKTKVQSVALTLLQGGKISTDQAKMMALRWQDKDDSGITTFNNGYVDLGEAEKVSKQWQDDDSKVKYKWTDVFKELKNIKDFGQETFGNSAPAAFFRELAKGAASGSTLEYIPYEMDDDYKSGIAKASAMAGGTIGNIAGFITLGRLAGGVGAVGHLFGLMNKGSKWLSSMDKASKLGGLSSKFSGLTSSLVKDISKAPSVGKAVNEALKVKTGMTSSKKIMAVMKEIDLFTTYGQLSRNGLLGQTITGEETEWKERAVMDIVSGGLMGGFSNAKQAAKQAGYVASGMTMLDAMMNVDNPDWTIESSLQHGLTVGGIHYLSLKSHGLKDADGFTVGGIKNLGFKGRGTTPETTGRQILNEQIDPSIETGIFASAKHDKELYKKLKKTTGLNVKALDEQIAKADEEMARLFDDIYGKESMERDFVTENNLRIIKMLRAREAFVRTLPEELQHEARVSDIISLANYVRKNPPVQTKMNSAFADSGTQVAKPRKIMSETNYSTDQAAADKLAAEGIVRFPTSGGATPRTQQNINNAKIAEADGRLSPDVIIVSRSEQGTQIRVSSEKDYAHPSKVQEVYAVETADRNGAGPYKYHLIGNVPETSTIDGYNTGRNAKFTTFDSAQGNKDAMADFMVGLDGKPVPLIKGTLEWASPSTSNEVGSAVIHVNKNTAIEDARLLNEKWSTRTRELEINQDFPTLAEKTLNTAGAPVDWINYHASEIGNAIRANNAQKLADVVNSNWGKNSMSLEGAQKILLDPSAFTIGDMLSILKKTSEWKSRSFVLDGMIRPPKGHKTTWKEYINTNLKTAEIPAPVKAAIPKTPPVQKTQQKVAEPVAPKEGEAVTLITDDGEMIAPKRYSNASKDAAKRGKASKPQVSKKKVPEGVSEALAGAAKSVKESPLAKEAEMLRKDPEMPQVMQKERTRPLSRIAKTNASTGQNTPVLRTPQAVLKPVGKTPATTVKKVISGAQSGADTAGLDAAMELGIPVGGTAAAGHYRFTDTGVKTQQPEITKKYGLTEGKWTDKTSWKDGRPYKDPWVERTVKNASESDGTLWMGNASPGKTLTIRSAKTAEKPILENPKDAEEIRAWIAENKIETLNVAGNREHTNVGIYEKTKKILKEALGEPKQSSPDPLPIRAPKSSESTKRSSEMAKDMEVLFEDAVETKIASLQEKNITDPDQIAKSASGVLRNMQLPPPAGAKSAKQTNSLDEYKLSSVEKDPFETTTKLSLFDKAFSPEVGATRISSIRIPKIGNTLKHGYTEKQVVSKSKTVEGYRESESTSSALRIMRAVGEENILVNHETGEIKVNPKSGLSVSKIMDKTGMSELQVLDGLDNMANTQAEVASLSKPRGRVLKEITVKPLPRGGSLMYPLAKIKKTEGGRILTVGEKRAYPGSGLAKWLETKAISAEGKRAKGETLDYDDALADTLRRGVSKIIGKKIAAKGLSVKHGFDFDYFLSKLSDKANPKYDRTTGKDMTQPKDLQMSRLKQERMRIGSMAEKERNKLFDKRRDEIEQAKIEKDLADSTARELASRKEDWENDPNVFGRTVEDKSQNLADNITISELEYMLPGMAARTGGNTVTATEGIKDAIILLRLMVKDRWDSYKSEKIKERPNIINLAEAEVKLRSEMDPEFKKILPLIKKKELKRVSEKIQEATDPTGTLESIEVLGSGGKKETMSFVKDPMPKIDVTQMIETYDGADPAGSKKIIETFLKKYGYKKTSTGKTYENVWFNQKYDKLIKATKEVKTQKEKQKTAAVELPQFLK